MRLVITVNFTVKDPDGVAQGLTKEIPVWDELPTSVKDALTTLRQRLETKVQTKYGADAVVTKLHLEN